MKNNIYPKVRGALRNTPNNISVRCRLCTYGEGCLSNNFYPYIRGAVWNTSNSVVKHRVAVVLKNNNYLKFGVPCGTPRTTSGTPRTTLNTPNNANNVAANE